MTGGRNLGMEDEIYIEGKSQKSGQKSSPGSGGQSERVLCVGATQREQGVREA